MMTSAAAPVKMSFAGVGAGLAGAGGSAALAKGAAPRGASSLALLQERLQYEFKDESLLLRALTHCSAGPDNNERLEFLGDSVLDLAVAHMLFTRLPASAEGDLTHVRKSWVNDEALHLLALRLDLQDALQLGKLDAATLAAMGGGVPPSILAGAFEAVIAAIFLDGGYKEAEKLVLRLFSDHDLSAAAIEAAKDSKSALQEWLQQRRLGLPVYEVKHRDGPTHAPAFTVECSVAALAESTTRTATGSRAAEQAAAAAMLRQLQARYPGPVVGSRFDPSREAVAAVVAAAAASGAGSMGGGGGGFAAGASASGGAVDPGHVAFYGGKQPKSALQEMTQKLGWPLPEYRVLHMTGPDNAPTFHVHCKLGALGDDVATVGTGNNRKTAEHDAAARMLRRLEGGGSGADEPAVTRRPTTAVRSVSGFVGGIGSSGLSSAASTGFGGADAFGFDSGDSDWPTPPTEAPGHGSILGESSAGTYITGTTLTYPGAAVLLPPLGGGGGSGGALHGPGSSAHSVASSGRADSLAGGGGIGGGGVSSSSSASFLAAKDPKNVLQEFCQKRACPLPVYGLVSHSGPPHAPIFTCDCRVVLPSSCLSSLGAGGADAAAISGVGVAGTSIELREQAMGSTRKIAEREAALAVLRKLNDIA